jgi:hypothetical protein
MEKNERRLLIKCVNYLHDSNDLIVYSKDLAMAIGEYPDVVANLFAMFDPFVILDPSYNLKRLLPDADAALLHKTITYQKEQSAHTLASLKSTYGSLTNFLYRKFTQVGGMFDPHVKLTDDELKDLKILVMAELSENKGKKEN